MKRAHLYCQNCHVAWFIPGHAYAQKTVVPFVMVKGKGVQKCRECGRSERVVILNGGKGMKVATRAAAVQRYGAIDFASKHWPGESKWMTLVPVEPTWFPKWVYAGTKHPVEHIYCNKDVAEPLKAALYAVHAKGLGELLHTYDGCLAIRMVRGTVASPSAHAYGLAIDLNAAENPLGAEHGGFFDHPKFVECFTNVGFTWGGNFHSRKDGMHMSFCWE